MPRANNTEIILADGQGPFIRKGSAKFRPPETTSIGRRGATVRAWTIGGQPGVMRVESGQLQEDWTRE